MIACGVRRAAGDLDVDRHDVGHRALDAVGAGEDAAVPGAVAHRDDHPGLGARRRRSCAAGRPCCG